MSEQKNKSNQLIKNIIRTALCRLILIGFGLYFTVYSSCINQNLNILAFLSCSLIVLIDTIYICVINKGIDHKWFINKIITQIHNAIRFLKCFLFI
jgi:hypothetical protein